MAESENTSGLRVLVVDDERAIRRFLNASLRAHGYAVWEASEGREVLQGLVSARPNVIILDLGLPDLDGIDVIRLVRERAPTPILILSAHEHEADKIAALDAGADDYLTKPFGVGELLARLRAVLRRSLQTGDKSVFKSGGLMVDLARRLVEVQGRPVHLTPTEYDVLKTLALHAGKVLTHRQILIQVWRRDTDDEGVAHLLRVTVSNLRSKLEPNPTRPDYILTEPGVGYRLRSDS